MPRRRRWPMSNCWRRAFGGEPGVGFRAETTHRFGVGSGFGGCFGRDVGGELGMNIGVIT